uniref:hypothetical protein n=1 Tax=Coprococcus catus TaxID=116085 RepID=UPI0022E5178B|nr:hypothetical protein [Coprococcus catus]
MGTKIISAFPACGKTYAFEKLKQKGYTMLDSDSSKFSLTEREYTEDELQKLKDEWDSTSMDKIFLIPIDNDKPIKVIYDDVDIKVNNDMSISISRKISKEELIHKIEEAGGNSKEIIQKLYEDGCVKVSMT